MEKHVQQTKITKSVLLSIPLVGAFVWFTSLVINVTNTRSGIALSPTRVNSLVNLLFLFIIIYGAFLFIMFYKMYRVEQILPAKKKKIKHKKKK